MSKKMKLYFCILALTFISVESQAKSCSVPKFLASWGLEMPAHMTVAKNFACRVLVTSTGQTSISIENPAKNGTATALQNGARYKSNKDFVGEDEFLIVRNGTDRYGSASQRRIRVKVKVVDE